MLGINGYPYTIIITRKKLEDTTNRWCNNSHEPGIICELDENRIENIKNWCFRLFTHRNINKTRIKEYCSISTWCNNSHKPGITS